MRPLTLARYTDPHSRPHRVMLRSRLLRDVARKEPVRVVARLREGGGSQARAARRLRHRRGLRGPRPAGAGPFVREAPAGRPSPSGRWAGGAGGRQGARRRGGGPAAGGMSGSASLAALARGLEPLEDLRALGHPAVQVAFAVLAPKYGRARGDESQRELDPERPLAGAALGALHPAPQARMERYRRSEGELERVALYRLPRCHRNEPRDADA
jgi:hypothetical protein